MPRGSNYVNNNRGVSLQASKKNKTRIVECSYGAACTRKGCIYSHPPKTSKAFTQSNEPCMLYIQQKSPFQTSWTSFHAEILSFLLWQHHLHQKSYVLQVHSIDERNRHVTFLFLFRIAYDLFLPSPHRFLPFGNSSMSIL